MLQVLYSAAGWYVGRLTEAGYPLSRESGYFASEHEAERELRFMLLDDTQE